ncbi:restriction endonuclease subunit S [Vibrio fluvialis]|uniref:restriction endonuclease subunit S n=1 Tax=Vibrio fluvialis TaxID=676 RepID=UPI003D7CAFAD
MGNISTYDSYVFNNYFGIDLPEHWDEKRLGYLASNDKNAFVDGPFGSDLKTNDYKEDGIPLIQLNNIRDGKHILRNFKYVTEQKKNELSRHIARPRDIVLAKMAEPVARSAIVSEQFDEYVIVADCVKMTPDSQKIDLNFLNWAINSEVVKTQAELVSTGTTRIRISLGELKKLKVPYPSHDEQTKIANFLDHETAKIDTLIEKQQQLIKLLKEKRQAVISHAVTKGLNPQAPMKNSGVEWLGEVPEHWDVSRIKYLSSIISKGTTPSTIGGDFVTEGVRFLKAENIGKSTSVKPFPEFFISEKVDTQLSRSRLKENDVLVIIAGATTGLASIVQKDVLPANTNQAVSFIRPANPKLSYWIVNWLTTEFVQSTIWMGAVQAAQPNLSMEDLGNIPIVVPPESELVLIQESLKGKLATLDNLMIKAESAISIMQERRTALISAAVTGKIDVRNWQAPTSQNQALEQTA